jgi:hypothetical protein
LVIRVRGHIAPMLAVLAGLLIALVTVTALSFDWWKHPDL